jgi:magnesium chelatase subunit D
MESAKGAVLSLLRESYRYRDRVGLLAFRGEAADLLLPLCTGPELAYRRLRDLPTGGKTPLGRGLLSALQTLEREVRKYPDLVPLVFLISDGRANVPLGGEIRRELRALARAMGEQGIRLVVIDTEAGRGQLAGMGLGFCREIARDSGGRYYSLSDLTAGHLAGIAHRERTAALAGDLP